MIPKQILDNVKLTPNALGLYTYIYYKGTPQIANGYRSVTVDELINHFQYATPHEMKLAMKQLAGFHYLARSQNAKGNWINVKSFAESGKQYNNLFNYHKVSQSSHTPSVSTDSHKTNDYYMSRGLEWTKRHQMSNDFNQVYLYYIKLFHRLPPKTYKNTQYITAKISSWLKYNNVAKIKQAIFDVRYHSKSEIEHPLAYLTCVLTKHDTKPMLAKHMQQPSRILRIQRTHNHKTIPTIHPASTRNPLKKLGRSFDRLVRKHVE